MNGLGKISFLNKSTNFGSLYLINKNEQVSFIDVRCYSGFYLPGMCKVVELANLVPEDEFITITKGDCSADGRDIFALEKLEAPRGSKLVLRTSLSFPTEVHKKIAKLLEARNMLVYDIKKFIKEYKDKQ